MPRVDVDPSWMLRRPRRLLGLCLPTMLVFFGSCGHVSALADEPEKSPRETLDRDAVDFFEFSIRPLLIDHCYDCHSVEADAAEGELRVDDGEALLSGGSRGAAVVPGKPDQSLIVRAIEYQDTSMQMPPDGKLDAESIEAIRTWIRNGAVDPRKSVVDDSMETTEQASPIDRDPSTHWAFVPPRRIHADRWQSIDTDDLPHEPNDPLDVVAMDAAVRHGAEPNDLADRETLIRRLYFDLVGTPPDVDQIARFVSDERPDAYQRLVDRLIAAPDFGERFARHWMDVARYADTIGYGLAGRDRRLHGSERYRDWLTRAFATDMPYDEMLMHQLAGDRTDPRNESGNLDAMGFLTIGRRFLNRHDVIDDRIDVVTRGLMGLTVTCARCHDHKFDPIPMSDYYSLYGVFQSSREVDEKHASPLAMVDVDKPRDTAIFLRGQPGNRGDVAPRRFLTSLRRDDEPRFNDGSGRLELARRIAGSENPLTARVMVNRVWGHLMGRHLIDSPSDFGFRTSPPAIPELLDDLAAEFAKDWSVQRLVRRIVTTRLYRQSSAVDEESFSADPDNQYFARAIRRRRDFESLRDSALCAAGVLDRQVGGPPVDITASTVTPRKTIYAMIDRQNLPSLFRTFDSASPDAHNPQRYFTTVPQQALFLINHRQSVSLSKSLAARVRASVRQDSSGGDPDDPSMLAGHLVRLVYGREPTDQESRWLTKFLRDGATPFQQPADSRTLWTYGTGRIGDGGVEEFSPLGVFQNDRWQAETTFPSPGRLGHAFLASENGHPGPGERGAVVRRWTVPRDGVVKVTGMIGHRNREGDGVVAAIFAGDRRLFRGTQKSNNRPLGPLTSKVRRGDVLDFAAGAGPTGNHDSFFWRINITLTAEDGEVIEADSRRDFSGPLDTSGPAKLDRLEQLAQVLWISNEFAFVD
ncbi:PSD1 and planctomycete cytochrome C domain-containing protein [Crateriforma conspicua]|uniref:Planctomycete cytochrome C n=1 Tax=Crateriforma conspicua TaxID=2527996 RepID=A0A5C6G2F6_9PLAN|nr:PSD1 and planctomycete cytochrome C domain-containing protein [Crateriforma conspicua]TWU67570.1 Planctomycete cytochrome C [Crateriforma conspicua]